jgi:hypothetical protein
MSPHLCQNQNRKGGTATLLQSGDQCSLRPDFPPVPATSSFPTPACYRRNWPSPNLRKNCSPASAGRQLGCRPELADGIQFFEYRRECIRKTPDCPRLEFLVLGLEVQIMHGSGKMLWSLQPAFYGRFVDDHLRGDVRQFASLPRFTCLRIGSKFRCMRSTPTEMRSMSENDFECFASTGVNTPVTMFPNSGSVRFSIVRGHLQRSKSACPADRRCLE